MNRMINTNTGNLTARLENGLRRTGVLCGRLIRHRESWRRFATKSAVLLAVLLAAGAGFMSRYRIGVDPQTERCIPDYSVYLIDLKDTRLERGNLYAFRSKDMSPLIEEGTRLLKYLRGMPGDRVSIDEDDLININGETLAQGLYHVDIRPGVSSDRFHGEAILGENQYWFLGISAMSFDSRYWGAVQHEDVIGRAYPLF